MILSKKIQEADRKAQAILADLIPMMDESAIVTDPEFIRHLEGALKVAEQKSEESKTGQLRDKAPAKQTEPPDKTVSNP